jgi:uncharacterized glyoxalase superfamily protein PhnB
MSTATTTGKATIIPCLRYRNAPAAMEWLCDNLGFEKNLVVPNADGTIAHAQLTLGASMMMLGSVTETEVSRLMKQPDEIGGAETQSCYVVVLDADEVYERVRAAGALIEMEIRDNDYGGRGFCCRDLEGHIWSVGSYDPWKTN